MNVGAKIIDEIIKQGMVRTQGDAPGVLVWSANAAEQLDGLVAHSGEVEVPKMVSDLFAKALAAAGAPMGPNDGDLLMRWAATRAEEAFNAQWYPVKEMIPQAGRPVLLVWVRGPGKDHTMRTGSWRDGLGWRGSGNVPFRTEPTHWRELPVLDVPEYPSVRRER